MTERTRQVLYIIAGATVAVLVLLFAVALYQGTASVPGEVQAAMWGLLVAAIGAISVYINVRSNTITRENSDRNAAQTQAKVEQVSADLHNGLAQEFGKTAANMVSQQAEVVAARLATTLTDTTAATAALQAIETNTEQIAQNTEPGGTPV